MKVWVIRLSMLGTLVLASPQRFSKSALSAGRAQPGHRPARRHPQSGPVAREAGPVARRRFSDDDPKRAAERSEAAEPNVEADFRHRAAGVTQQLHRPLHPPTLKIF